MSDLIAYLGAAEGYEALEEAARGKGRTLNVEPEPDAVRAALAEADAVLDASMRVRLTDEMIAAAPNLRIISCATTGSDHIARGAADERGIEIRTLREDPELLQNLTPAAELSWALLLACARQLPAAVSHVLDGNWRREEFPGAMLRGRQLGIVGVGRIGGWMARYAHAFGMEVAGYDPNVAVLPEGIRALPLGELVRTSDFLTIHVHLDEHTRGMISAEMLAQAKPGMVLVNTARAAAVDEAALLAGLQDGRIAAAGLDVLEGEPDVGAHPLVAYARTHSNVVITPHIGGFSPDAVRIVCRRAAEKILELLAS
jgi:D-3-phosphoglycerate dehydrogenase